jgi:deoxyribonucleoside regulator
MAGRRTPQERLDLLADVAQMYHHEGKKQQEIAKIIGVTRSMVSRMLTEAYEKGVVTVQISRKVQYDDGLAEQLRVRFGLTEVTVIHIESSNYRKRLLPSLGKAGAETLTGYLVPGTRIGLTWGSSVATVINHLEVEYPIAVKVVQLAGSLGAQNNAYNGQVLTQSLAAKLDGEGFFLNAPFLCPTSQVAESLIATPGLQEVIALGKEADVLLAGVGSLDPEQSSMYRSGHLSLTELDYLAELGAVGDVCGRNFDIQGRPIATGYGPRLVTIQTKDLMAVPIRIGVAGGPKKAKSILGALRGGYINVLVTDSATAKMVLDQSE